jgi:ABC-type glycerol-3-phosphate transport system substrate-binding protein
MSKFKIGLSIIFTAFIIIAVIVFATSKGTSSSNQVPVTVWGFLPQASFESFMRDANLISDKSIVITYVEKTPANFQNDFVNALANGVGPDVVMISQDMIAQNENKLFTIPYANYNERTFKDSFIQEGELFLSPTGVVAVPFMIDPLVMYWNRDIFNSASIPNPPKYFDELMTLPTQLSKVDQSGNITQSTVALGDWQNVNNAKGILSDILLSAGSSIVDTTGQSPRSSLLDTTNQAISPAESSVNFYTQFANPTSQTYSWNRSMANSLDVFLGGNLAVYFGFASELATIRAKNPNLNFDVAFMLQPRPVTNTNTKKVVFGNIYGLAIVKQSHNVSSAFQAISDLTSDSALSKLQTYTNLPPVKRSLLATMPTDPYMVTFYQSALVASGWFDPDSSATDQIFQNMIESITSGRARTSDSISTASQQLDSLFK